MGVGKKYRHKFDVPKLNTQVGRLGILQKDHSRMVL